MALTGSRFKIQSWSGPLRLTLHSPTALRFNYFRSLNSISHAAESAPVVQSSDWMKNLYGSDNEFLTGRRPSKWFTGIDPSTRLSLEGVSNAKSHVSSLPQLWLKSVTKESIKNYFDNTWLMTEVLLSGLQTEEAFYRPPYHHLRHPMIFYYGHPATFYVNKLRVAGLLQNHKHYSKGIDPYLEEIFEVGVDEMRWDDISTVAKSWPKVSDVTQYRKKVHALVHEVIDAEFANSSQTITQETPLWALIMAMEHERIHVETSSVLMRELPIKLLRKPDVFPRAFIPDSSNKSIPKNELIKVPAQDIILGKPVGKESDALFGWDNEYGTRRVSVPAFQCSKYKVTNAEYMEFVKAGGYRERKFWSEDGWGWRTFRNQKWPVFWVQRGPAGSHDYALRTIFEVIEMPLSAPVVVNYHEASAFCNWLQEKDGLGNVRLITEAEHHCIKDSKLMFPLVGDEMRRDPATVLGADTSKINNHLAYGSETPVDLLPPNDKGFHDVFGNVWDWAEDDFNFLEGFKVHPYYDDFSAPCFDGEHNMILGGSFMSCSDNGGNIFSRYHFRPHFHQHAGFRYVVPSKAEVHIKGEGVATFLGAKAKYSAVAKTETSNEPEMMTSSNANMNTYETARLLDQYMALHFGQGPKNVDATVKNHIGRPDHALQFPQRTARLLSGLFKSNNNRNIENARALDVGCAVGAASFEMANNFKEVVGFDYSASFVAKAKEIQCLGEKPKVYFQVPVQGDIMRSNIEAEIPPKIIREKCLFKVGDATTLNDLNEGKFDAILCSNLLCRLPDPLSFLQQLPSVTNDNAIVLFVSPYSWLEEFTPKNKWLIQGDKMSSEGLKSQMKLNGFELIHEEEMPLIIREHERKYQYIISQAMGFRKEVK